MSLDQTLMSPQRPRRWKILRWTALVVVILAIGIGIVFGGRLGTDPTLVDSPLIGQPASSRAQPYLQRDGTLSLTELRDRVVVVNFWASWCAACREEHPALLAAARNYRAAGVSFVGVNYQDRRSSATGFLDELGRGGPNYRYVVDRGSRLGLDFGVFGLPETFVIDRSGTIVAKITGPSSYRLLSRTLDAVLAGRKPHSRLGGAVTSAPPGRGGG